WTENGITWNNRPLPSDMLGAATVTGTAYAWYQVDVTSYLQSEVSAGHDLVSFALHNPSSASSTVIQVASRETATPPQLAITTNAVSTVPAPPSALAATAGPGAQITLNWTDNSGNEDGFKIERSTDDAAFTQIATAGANATSYPDGSLAVGTTYYYRVRAF